jgi:hypothetical protein
VTATRFDPWLREAARRVAPLGALAPTNLVAEVNRLVAAGGRGAPAFAYGELPRLDDVRRAMLVAAETLARGGPEEVLLGARASEVVDECALIAARGTSELAERAALRFGRRDAFDDEADALAKRWLAEEVEPRDRRNDSEVWSDDGSDPRSLLARMRAELARRDLAVRVVVSNTLAPLAAVGGGAVQIAGGRRLRVSDVERTVLHEIEGHVVPMERARRGAGLLPAIGSARGSDEQEGLALWLEARAGHLVGRRRRELALRHVAARAVHGGHGFERNVEQLRALGAAIDDAVRIACRAHRGAGIDGVGGLGREAAYLPAYCRVRAALRDDASLVDTLQSGRLSVAAAQALRALELAGMSA